MLQSDEIEELKEELEDEPKSVESGHKNDFEMDISSYK